MPGNCNNTNLEEVNTYEKKYFNDSRFIGQTRL